MLDDVIKFVAIFYNFGCVRTCTVRLSVTASNMPKASQWNQAGPLIFTCRPYISTKIVLYILFIVKGVFRKDLALMLFRASLTARL